MRLLMVVGTGDYTPLQLGGGARGNRALCEALAGRGHTVQAVIPAPEGERRRAAASELSAQGAEFVETGLPGESPALRFRLDGVEVHAVTDRFGFTEHLRREVERFRPEGVLVANEYSTSLLELVAELSPRPLCYVAHDVLGLPFGPHAAYGAQPRRHRLLREHTRVVAVSRFVADYLRTWGGIEAEVGYLPAYGPGPFRDLARFDAGFVTLVNPCPYKGVDIFAGLADRLPDLSFAAVPAWETRELDVASLARRPNVTLLEARPDIEEILRQTRALLLPSIVQEGFPLIVNEAMARGIPVLASNAGGAAEAKLGTEFVLPVRAVETWERDDRCTPTPVIPPQDLEPWIAALRELLSSRATYEAHARAAYERAGAFIRSIDVTPFEAALGCTAPRDAT